MTVFISMLRGINVGGNKRIRMDGLVTLFESLGFANFRTYLQSGNVIFSSENSNPVNLSEQIEKQILTTYGFPVKVILRSFEEMRDVITGNPFLKEAGVNTDTLHATFLSDALQTDADRAGQVGVDRYVIIGREAYLSCPEGYGRTKFSNTFFERKLKVTATTRNWKTVTALLEMADALSGKKK